MNSSYLSYGCIPFSLKDIHSPLKSTTYSYKNARLLSSDEFNILYSISSSLKKYDGWDVYCNLIHSHCNAEWMSNDYEHIPVLEKKKYMMCIYYEDNDVLFYNQCFLFQYRFMLKTLDWFLTNEIETKENISLDVFKSVCKCKWFKMEELREYFDDVCVPANLEDFDAIMVDFN
jgi:hypothetical protein